MSPCYQFHIHFTSGETVSPTKDVELQGAPCTDPPQQIRKHCLWHAVSEIQAAEITADQRFRSLILELENFR